MRAKEIKVEYEVMHLLGFHYGIYGYYVDECLKKEVQSDGNGKT